MRNLCYENDFDLHENEIACRTNFHMKSFALILALKQRHKGARKWPISKADGQKGQKGHLFYPVFFPRCALYLACKSRA